MDGDLSCIVAFVVERETEAMNRARQMVFGADHNLAVPHPG